MTGGPRQGGSGGGLASGDALTRLRGAVFDTDGVLADTAALHAAAWKSVFDELLTALPPSASAASAAARRPFDAHEDYLAHVDGRAREDGARAFLASRGLELPGPELDALLARKDARYLRLLHERGAVPVPGSVAFVRALRGRGVPTAAVSASRHCAEVLASAKLTDLFPVRVDGVDAQRLHLPGKPDPALFLEAARRLGAPPERTLLVEDALAGVEAGRRGGFDPVVGLDRGAGAEELVAHGAGVVVRDLSELLPP